MGGVKLVSVGEGVRAKVLVYVSNLRLLGSRMLPKLRGKKMLAHKGLTWGSRINVGWEGG